MSVTFDDLISTQYLDAVSVPIPGVGVVEIQQLSAIQVNEVVEQSEGLEGEELESFISSKALGFVKGSKPTDAEVEKFRGNLTKAAIGKIYTSALLFDDSVLGDLEDAEKN